MGESRSISLIARVNLKRRETECYEEWMGKAENMKTVLRIFLIKTSRRNCLFRSERRKRKMGV